MKFGFLIILFLVIGICDAQSWKKLNNYDFNWITSFASDNGKLYIGENYAGNGIYNIKIWDGITLDSLPCVGQALKMKIYSGELYECGCNNGIRKFNGSSWVNIGMPDGNKGVADFHFFNNEIFAVGSFDSINGIAAHGIARWDGTIWHPIDTTNFNSGIFRFSVHYNNELYVGGAFSNWNSTLGTLIRWDGTQWQNAIEGLVSGYINPNCATVFNNELYLGGDIRPTNGFGNGILKFNGQSWGDVKGGVKSNFTPIVNSFHELNNELFVVGNFDSVANFHAPRIAVWNGIKWCAMSLNIDGSVIAVSNFSDSIVVGGAFNIVDGDSIHNLAIWTGGNNYYVCDSTASIWENSNSRIGIFPNPSTGKIAVDLSEYSYNRNFAINIYNLYGVLVFKEKINEWTTNLKFDLSFLPSTGYYIKIVSGEKNYFSKFILQK